MAVPVDRYLKLNIHKSFKLHTECHESFFLKFSLALMSTQVEYLLLSTQTFLEA